MKRTISFVLGVFLCCSLASCSDDVWDLSDSNCSKVQISILNMKTGEPIEKSDSCGGTASGSGIYGRHEVIKVSVTPNKGYEIKDFYGGSCFDTELYNYKRDSLSSIRVNTENGNQVFFVSFKKKTHSK